MDQNLTSNNQNKPQLLESIPLGMPLTNIYLPQPWVFYLYDKQLFKKIANRPNFQAKPHKEICTINTINDLLYILQLMAVKPETKNKTNSVNNKINLDVNDYIIMRKGIEPIWEDPKNSNGGTFTIKMAHSKGYDVWSSFIMYMLGETMCDEMQNINGITVSYISDINNFHNPNLQTNNSYTYIKIWDAQQDRTREQFVNILPPELLDKIKNESLMYSQNNKKKDYGEKNIISKISNNKPFYRDRGGFINKKY